MKKDRLLALLLALCMLFALVACGGSKPEPAAPESSGKVETPVADDSYDLNDIEKRVYSLGHVGSVGSTNDYWGHLFSDIVAAKSDGKMVIEVYPASQLGSDVTMATDVAEGALDFEISTPAAMPSFVPEAAAFDMPFLFSDIATARKAVLNDEFFSALQDAYANAGVHLFPLTDQGFRCITTNKKIEKFEDFKGMSIRTMNNPHHINFFTEMGCAATPLNASEIFLALQQGMLDGQENPWSQILDKGLYDVQDYVTNSNHIYYIATLMMGKDNWESLSATEQTILWDAAEECVPLMYEFTDSIETESLDKLINEHGMSYIDFDKIPGMRESLLDKTFESTYKSITDVIGNELVDKYIAAAGFSDRIPK